MKYSSGIVGNCLRSILDMEWEGTSRIPDTVKGSLGLFVSLFVLVLSPSHKRQWVNMYLA